MNKLLILLICVVLVLSACGGAESRKEKYLASGNEHFHDNDCKKAKLDYKNTLQIDPKTVDALVGLSRCAIEEKEWRSAYQFLLAALETDPNSIDAKLDLAKIYLISGDNQKSYQLIEEVLSNQPENATALALRGIFHLKNNTVPAARTDSSKALQSEESNLTAITLFSSLEVKDGETENAVEYIEKQLESSDVTKRTRKELQAMLIALYGQLKDTDNIIKIYQQLIEQYPDDNTYAYRLAAIYAGDGRIQNAENLLLNNIESSDDKLTYIAFLDKYKSEDIATKALEDYARDDDGKLKLALGKRYLQQDKIEQAKSLFEALSKDISQVEHLEAKNELTLLALKDNDTKTALGLLEEVLSEQPTNLRALVLRGTLALSRRDAPAAIADFRTVLRDQPNNTFAIRQLAVGYILNDQQDLAKELVQKAVEIDSNDKQLGLLYARLQGDEQNFEAAIDTVNELLTENEDDLDTIKTLFDLQIANRDYVGAKQTAESMKTVMGDNPLGYYLSGVLLQNENNPVEAEKQYLIALDKQPRANEPLTGLVRLYLSQDMDDKAIALLNKYIKDDPEYLVPYNLLGEVALSKKDYVLAKNSFESAIKVNDQWWVPYRGLSLTYIAQGDREKAIRALEQGYNRGAGTERLGLELALAYYQQGDRAKAISTYENIIGKVPTSILSKNNLAMILVDSEASTEDINQAIVFADELESINEAASLDTVGWVNYRAGNIAKAIEILERAVALAPNAAELHYHLGMAHTGEGGDITKAKEHLKIATESTQEFPGKDQALETLKSL